ncbi:hypothetical protein F5B20DRAFT_488754 [Whalleya microplaca]|nr:hypothetical protein F5B20DRAFT_488754 [Whalleya microplaca]
MAPAPPIPTYALGTLCLGLGLHSFLAPKREYARFGLPLEQTSKPHRRPSSSARKAGGVATAVSENGAVSPLVYLKAVREVTYGLSLILLQYAGASDAAVTITTAVISLAGLGDGLVVWAYGGADGRKRAWGHWAAFLGLSGWAWWRAKRM